MAKSTKSKQGKSKATKTDSLWVHKGKQLWCKKVGGRFYYFGDVATDPNGDRALSQWLSEKDRITSIGPREPRQPQPAKPDEMTVLELTDRYLVSKQRRLSPLAYRSAKVVCERMVRCFGADRAVTSLTADDFEAMLNEAAETMGPASLDDIVTRTKCVFNWARNSGRLDHIIRYGEFKLSSTAERLRDANEKGDKILPREDILKLIKAATVQMRAMIYLAINAGYGPTDLGSLKLSDIDGGEWLSVPRKKTGAPRRCWLWPETRKAIADWLAVRPTDVPEEIAELVFFTKAKKSWVTTTTRNPVAEAFTYLAKKCDVKHRGFYGLRHTHRTVSDESLDQPACGYIMGHIPPRRDMSSVYRKPKHISDDRIKAVCEVVRNWLLGKKKRKSV